MLHLELRGMSDVLDGYIYGGYTYKRFTQLGLNRGTLLLVKTSTLYAFAKKLV